MWTKLPLPDFRLLIDFLIGSKEAGLIIHSAICFEMQPEQKTMGRKHSNFKRNLRKVPSFRRFPFRRKKMHYFLEVNPNKTGLL